MKGKKVIKALLYPHPAVMVLLLPPATVLLVGVMLYLGSESPVAILSYVLAFYTLTVWCLRIPALIDFFKRFKAENRLARRWLEDDRLRVRASLYGALIANGIYSVFQLWLGFYHGSLWFYSMAGYYLSLAVMRFFLLRYMCANHPGERMREELIRYRACGWIFLVMNLAVSLMIFFMVYWNRTFHHHEITTIALAAYTFTSFSFAIVNLVKYRRYHSPVYTATKAISLAAACVSMLTLEATMLTTFGQGDEGFRQVMLGATGAAISVFVIAMAILMIVQGTLKLKQIRTEVQFNGTTE